MFSSLFCLDFIVVYMETLYLNFIQITSCLETTFINIFQKFLNFFVHFFFQTNFEIAILRFIRHSCQIFF